MLRCFERDYSGHRHISSDKLCSRTFRDVADRHGRRKIQGSKHHRKSASLRRRMTYVHLESASTGQTGLRTGRSSCQNRVFGRFQVSNWVSESFSKSALAIDSTAAMKRIVGILIL